MLKSKDAVKVTIVGLFIGAFAILLMTNGNPANMGFCLACFIRDTAGALKLHSAPVVQYLRPEIIGLILGSFIISLATHEFKVRGGSSPMLRFAMGFMVMLGALVFLGCPLRMVLRMGGGDLNAWIGLIGFALGVIVGSLFLRNGFSLKRSHSLSTTEGAVLPLAEAFLLVVLLAFPAVLAFSEKGPGSMHAPIWMSLVLALLVGAGAQKTRLCQAGGIRDLFLFKDPTLFYGGVAIFLAALVGNLLAGTFHLGLLSQPIAHSESLWNILGLFVVGLGSTLLGGCPMRQLVLAGTGNTDSAITVMGMLLGAAFAHNFGIASGADAFNEQGVRTAGTTAHGRIAVIVCIVLLLAIGVLNSRKSEKA